LNAGPPPTEGNYWTSVTVNLAPASRGRVFLKSADPWAYAGIDPNILGTEYDVRVAIAGVYCSLHFFSWLGLL
jgi:hypothetical protein